jgi:hypothetical protein
MAVQRKLWHTRDGNRHVLFNPNQLTTPQHAEAAWPTAWSHRKSQRSSLNQVRRPKNFGRWEFRNIVKLYRILSRSFDEQVVIYIVARSAPALIVPPPW